MNKPLKPGDPIRAINGGGAEITFKLMDIVKPERCRVALRYDMAGERRAFIAGPRAGEFVLRGMRAWRLHPDDLARLRELAGLTDGPTMGGAA